MPKYGNDYYVSFTMFWRALISFVRICDAGVPYHFCHSGEDEDRHDMLDRTGSFVSDYGLKCRTPWSRFVLDAQPKTMTINPLLTKNLVSSLYVTCASKTGIMSAALAFKKKGWAPCPVKTVS
jgi:hypothetical protein